MTHAPRVIVPHSEFLAVGQIDPAIVSDRKRAAEHQTCWSVQTYFVGDFFESTPRVRAPIHFS